MKNYIPDRYTGGGDNPFLTHFMLSGDLAAVLTEAGTIAAGLFTAVVAKDSGDLSRSPVVTPPFIGGPRFDRLELDVVSGRGTKRGGYGASHEHGIGIHPKSRVPPTVWMPQQPVDDWVKVLAIMDSLT